MGGAGGDASRGIECKPDNETKQGEAFSQRRNLQKQPALSPHNGSVPAGFVDSSARAGLKKKKKKSSNSPGSEAPYEEYIEYNERLLGFLSQMTLERGLSPAGQGGTCQD